MSFHFTLFSPQYRYTILGKYKSSARVVSVGLPTTFDEGFQLSKELFNGTKSGEYGGKYTSKTPGCEHIRSISRTSEKRHYP
jgi:hypothetical protein